MFGQITALPGLEDILAFWNKEVTRLSNVLLMQTGTATANNGQDERKPSTWRSQQFWQCVALSKPLLNKFKMEDGEKSEAGNGKYITHCVALRHANTLL